MSTAKICFLGNSHLAALKYAWDARQPDYDADWFAASRYRVAELVRNKGRLETPDRLLGAALQRSSGGKRHVLLGGYDAFVIMGLYSVHPLVDLHRTHRSVGAAADGPIQLLSPTVYDHTARAALRDWHAIRLARRIRQGSDRPIFVLDQPLPTTHWDMDGNLWRLLDQGDGQVVARVFDDETRRLSDELDFQYLPQPAATRHSRWFSHPQYSRAREVDGVAQANDHSHMNRDYGALYLDALLPRLPG